MDVGVLSYGRKPLALDGRDVQNIGDWIQTIAATILLKSWRINNVKEISKFTLNYYEGDYTLLMCNGFNETTRQIHTPGFIFPSSNKIVPLFMSFHLHNGNLEKEMIEGLKRYEPIGCRDEETMSNLRKQGIECYLSGCITALLPQRKKKSTQTKVLCIDVSDTLKKYIDAQKFEEIEYFTHLYPIKRTKGENSTTEQESKEIYEYAKNRLKYYEENAALVITSRLHVASPCMAMGIPVILASDNFDGRFSWIDKYLPLYTPDNYNKIDWHPEPVHYEEEKEWISSMLKEHFFRVYKKYNSIYELSSYYEKREKAKYNKEIFNLLEIWRKDLGEEVKYAIWGTVNNSAIIKRLIDDNLKGWHLEHVIDKNCSGKFEGMEIQKPECIELCSDETIFFIIPPSAHKAVSELLRSKGKKYVLVNGDYSTTYSWEESVK